MVIGSCASRRTDVLFREETERLEQRVRHRSRSVLTKGQRERCDPSHLDFYLLIPQRTIEHGQPRHEARAEVHARLAVADEDTIHAELPAQQAEQRTVQKTLTSAGGCPKRSVISWRRLSTSASLRIFERRR